MDYVDENIMLDNKTIREGIMTVIGVNEKEFGFCFSIITGKTLLEYIKMRKLFFASQSLINEKERTIVDIALDYGYSEGSSFSRDMRALFNVTPREIRNLKAKINHNKYKLEHFSQSIESGNERVNRILSEWGKTGEILPWDESFLMRMIEAQEEFGVGMGLCSKIEDLADELGLPFHRFMKICVDMIQDIISDPDYIHPLHEAVMDWGLQSVDELAKICDFYGCKYHDLNDFMVNKYVEQKQSNKGGA